MFASICTLATSGMFTVLDGAEKVRATANKGRRNEEMFSSKLGRSFKAATTAFRAEWNSTAQGMVQVVQDATDDVVDFAVVTATVTIFTARRTGSAAKRTARRARSAARRHVTARNVARVAWNAGLLGLRVAAAQAWTNALVGQGNSFGHTAARAALFVTFFDVFSPIS